VARSDPCPAGALPAPRRAGGSPSWPRRLSSTTRFSSPTR
jgi:hypothetical protein